MRDTRDSNWVSPRDQAMLRENMSKFPMGKQAYKKLAGKMSFEEALAKQPKFDPRFAGQGARNFVGTSMRDLGLEQQDYNQAGLQQFEKEAIRDPGTASAWATMAQQERERGLNQNLQNAANQAASGTANAWSQMAQSGGLRGGQRMRLASTGIGNQLSSQQGLMAQSEADASKIRMQDEQNRLTQLQALPEMYSAYRAPQIQNMQTKLGLMGVGIDLQKTKAAQEAENYGNMVSGWGAYLGAK